MPQQKNGFPTLRRQEAFVIQTDQPQKARIPHPSHYPKKAPHDVQKETAECHVSEEAEHNAPGVQYLHFGRWFGNSWSRTNAG